MDLKEFTDEYIYGREKKQPKSTGAMVISILWNHLSGLFVGTLIVLCWYPLTTLIGMNQFISIGSSVMIILMCTLIGVSKRAKCAYCLVLFRFCSSRSVLLTAMLYLATTVPFNNIMKNFDAVSESYTCIKDSSKKGVEAYSGTMFTLSDKINEFAANINRRVKLIRQRYDKLMEIVEKGHHILDVLAVKCSKRAGNPYKSCLSGIEHAYNDCRRKHFGLFCKLVNVAKPFCNIARVGEILCMINAKVSNWIKSQVKTKIDAVFKELDEMLFVHVNVTVISEMKVNKSKTLRGVKADIKQDMDEYLWPIVRFVMSNLPFVASLISLPWIICRSHAYVAAYVNDLSFDNNFLDFEVVQIDARRKKKGKTTVLPLETWENKIYISILTPRLSSNEFKALMASLVRATFITTVIIGLFFVDFGLYYIVSAIQLPLNVGAIPEPREAIVVEGNGSVEQLLSTMVNTTNTTNEIIPDPSFCLPQVVEPDYPQYSRIAIWCVTYALFEIVVIIWRRRLYHVIAAAVFPERQRLRARWLVLHILAERKLVHHSDRLARIYQPLLFADLTSNFFFMDIFYLRCSRLRAQCWSCGYATFSTNEEFRICLNLHCDGVYCTTCLALVEYICPACKGRHFFDHA